MRVKEMLKMNDRKTRPSLYKRHTYQKNASEHFDTDDVLNDNQLVEKIHDLYDRGITLKMIDEVYKELEERRAII